MTSKFRSNSISDKNLTSPRHPHLSFINTTKLPHKMSRLGQMPNELGEEGFTENLAEPEDPTIYIPATFRARGRIGLVIFPNSFTRQRDGNECQNITSPVTLHAGALQFLSVPSGPFSCRRWVYRSSSTNIMVTTKGPELFGLFSVVMYLGPRYTVWFLLETDTTEGLKSDCLYFLVVDTVYMYV